MTQTPWLRRQSLLSHAPSPALRISRGHCFLAVTFLSRLARLTKRNGDNLHSTSNFVIGLSIKLKIACVLELNNFLNYMNAVAA